MSTSEAGTPSRPRFRLRHFFLVLGPALAAVGIAAMWWLMAVEWDLAHRVVGSGALTILAVLWVLGWVMLYSRLRWLVLGGVVLVIGLACAVIGAIDFSGDLIPRLRFRWEATNDDVLEAHRRQRTDPAALPDIVADTGDPADFPEYRNRRRDGTAHGPPLNRDWQAQPPRQLWRQPCGGGYAGFAVAGNVAVTIEQRRDKETVVCYDIDSGRERWVYDYPARFFEVLGGEGPRATPTIVGDEVYSLGATGRLARLELRTGKEKWAVEILEDNDNLSWAMSGSPLVHDKVVVVNPGTQRSSAAGRALVAYDRETGEIVWQAGSHRAGYSSPMLAELCGRRLILNFDGKGLAGHDAANGQELWYFPWETQQDINVAQPLVLSGDRVFISSGYGVGCAMLQVKRGDGRWSVLPLWKNKNMRCKFTSPVFHDGFIYGLDEGILVCLDPKSGERRWKDGRYGHGQVLLSQDLLVVLAESGKLALVEATPAEFRELASLQAIEGKTWNVPALARGKVFVRNHLEMAGFDLNRGE